MVLADNPNPSKVLNDYSVYLRNSFINLDMSVFDDVLSFNIDCSTLPPFSHFGFNQSSELNAIISTLDGNGRNGDSAVYWIEVVSQHSAKDLHEPYGAFKNELMRSLPAYKKTFNKWDSRVLYVGKAKSNIAGRMVLHLGYEARPNLQGLQLCHWNYNHKLQDLKLQLNIIYLPKELAALAQVFELQLAKALHPILGKHS